MKHSFPSRLSSDFEEEYGDIAFRMDGVQREEALRDRQPDELAIAGDLKEEEVEQDQDHDPQHHPRDHRDIGAAVLEEAAIGFDADRQDRKSTRLNSSH